MLGRLCSKTERICAERGEPNANQFCADACVLIRISTLLRPSCSNLHPADLCFSRMSGDRQFNWRGVEGKIRARAKTEKGTAWKRRKVLLLLKTETASRGKACGAVSGPRWRQVPACGRTHHLSPPLLRRSCCQTWQSMRRWRHATGAQRREVPACEAHPPASVRLACVRGQLSDVAERAVAAWCGRGAVGGDPGAWSRSCAALEAVRAAARPRGARLVVAIVQVPSPPTRFLTGLHRRQTCRRVS